LFIFCTKKRGIARVASEVAYLRHAELVWGLVCPELRYRWFGVIHIYRLTAKTAFFSCKLKMSKNGSSFQLSVFILNS